MLRPSRVVTKRSSLHSAARPLQESRPTLASEPKHPLRTCTPVRYQDVRLGLRGGSPMWPSGGGRQREEGGGDKMADELAASARAQVASLVAADYNDFDDDNSQPTPPPPGDAEISTELELLAESENIAIVDGATTGPDVGGVCATSDPGSEAGLADKIQQVVEEDEQHVVMMIEENTLTASFSVEHGDKLVSKTFMRKLKHSDADGVAAQTGSSGDVKGNREVKDRYGSMDVVHATFEDEQKIINDRRLTTVDSENAMDLVQMHTGIEITDDAENNVVKNDVMLGSSLFEKNSTVDMLEIIPDNNEDVNIVLGDSTVLDLSTTLQDSSKMAERHQGIIQQLEGGKEESRQVSISQKMVKTNPSIPLPVNKKLKGVGQMLLVADSPESPDQQEVNVDPSPETSFHEFESLFNKMGQGTENATVPSAKHEEITTSSLPKDVSVSVRAKESIFALLQEEHDNRTLPGIEPKQCVEFSNSLKSSSSSREQPSLNSNPKANVGAHCSPVNPSIANPTKSNHSTNTDTVSTKPTLSEQQNFIVSRGAISISLLDPSASPSVAIQSKSKSTTSKPDAGVSDVVSIQRRRISDQLGEKGKTTPSPPPGSVVTTEMSVPACLPSLVCSALSTVTISVITSSPRDASLAHTTTSSSRPTETQPSAVKTKHESASTVPSVLQVTTASPLPSGGACTLSVVNADETYVPLTGIASSVQVSRLLNLPARSLQTLIENNQLFKSSPSNSQARNVLVSSTQSRGEPTSSRHESAGTKPPLAPTSTETQPAPRLREAREVESQPHTSAQYQSRNGEATLHSGENTKTVPGFDDAPKLADQSKSTMQMQQSNAVNFNKTASQVHPQIVSVLESRLMSSSEYNYQHTPVTTSTSIGNVTSLQPDNTTIRTVPQPTLYSRQVPSTVTTSGIMATNTTNLYTSNHGQSVVSQPIYSMPKGNASITFQQPSPVTPIVKVKEENMDDGCYTPSHEVVHQASFKISPSNRLEESQNVLLKQLLQNTGCAQTQSVMSVPSLEAQLAQPVPSTPSALLSPLLLDTGPQPQFKGGQSQACMTVSRTPSREELPSPLPSPKREAPPPPIATPPTLVTPKTEPSLPEASPKREVPLPQASPKREVPLPQASPKREPPPAPLMSPKREVPQSQPSPNKEMQLGLVEIKKEVIEETDRKADFGHIPDQSPSDIKKMKRRQYQQKRRQSQGKEAAGGPSKKRQKKVTTVEEDWDTYMETLMQNLQQLPSIHVQEPSLPSNPIVGIIFGAGDPSKLADSAASRFGDLHGTYGSANLFQVSDYYDSKPFGPGIPLPPPLPATTQRGFYDQEFAPLKFGADLEDRRVEAPSRDLDSPQSVLSSSSPECAFPEPPVSFPGLRLIRPDSDEDSEGDRSLSPVLPPLAPTPIRPAPADDKENRAHAKPRPPSAGGGNVAVTLTLSSAAAADIVGVLRDLANILRVPPPTGYQIVERTSTPPSQKLGLYRCKGRDAPIDIQSILNGEAKFCRHCDVVVLNNSVRKKASDLPFLAREDVPDNEDFLSFCSTACYMQFALMHRLPSVTQDKAAATVDHLCRVDNEGDVKGEEAKGDDVKDEAKDDVKVEAKGEEAAPAKSVCFKTWSPGALQPAKKTKRASDRETTELLFRMGITVTPARLPDDTRSCVFCRHVGDGVADGPARLLNYDVDRWVHLNCALWSDDVYETVNGALMNLDNALRQSRATACVACRADGASIRCFKLRCSNVYHLGCAVKAECVFFENKTVYCPTHVPKNERDNELTTLAVFRRVYVDRDENRQVASVMHRSDHDHLMRVGSLVFLNVGQLLPHQLQAFHTVNCIYPVGYRIVRFYWSMRVHNKRCRYVCSIHDVAGRPEFRVLVQEPDQADLELRDSSPRAVWARILEPMAAVRREMGGIQVFPRFVSGEDLFGLTEPAIVRVLESLPGVESMSDYRFKYGRNPLLELPLAVNPTGSARSEPKLRIAYPWKRPHTQRTATSSRPVFVPTATVAGEAACPYSKQFVHSKSSQYKKMKQDWRNNVYLARSKIQGLGLYAARDLERHTMVIEYIGEVIRTELSELREKLYEARNRGIYMFRLDEERVVDATLSGGLARYINHSCNPNCVAEIVEVDRDLRIIIFAKKRISRGEELAYDYKFDIEDDQHKIPCNCGAANCKKWMN